MVTLRRTRFTGHLVGECPSRIIPWSRAAPGTGGRGGVVTEAQPDTCLREGAQARASAGLTPRVRAVSQNFVR